MGVTPLPAEGRCSTGTEPTAGHRERPARAPDGRYVLDPFWGHRRAAQRGGAHGPLGGGALLREPARTAHRRYRDRRAGLHHHPRRVVPDALADRPCHPSRGGGGVPPARRQGRPLPGRTRRPHLPGRDVLPPGLLGSARDEGAGEGPECQDRPGGRRRATAPRPHPGRLRPVHRRPAPARLRLRAALAGGVPPGHGDGRRGGDRLFRSGLPLHLLPHTCPRTPGPPRVDHGR